MVGRVRIPYVATWNPRGFWVVALANKLLRLVDGELHHLTNSPDMAVGAVACSEDGAAIGMQLGDALVLVMSWPAASRAPASRGAYAPPTAPAPAGVGSIVSRILLVIAILVLAAYAFVR